MPKYRVYGVITATKYLGEFEAENEEQAEEMASKVAYVSICHQCSREIEGPEISEIIVDKVE